VRQHYLAKEETQKTVHWCFVGAAQSTAAALSTSFLLNHDPESPKLNALITRVRVPYSSMNMSRESEKLKTSISNWLNSGSALIQQVKMQFLCFPILSEEQVI